MLKAEPTSQEKDYQIDEKNIKIDKEVGRSLD